MSKNYWKSYGSYSDIRFEKSEEGIAKITINRPKIRNAFRPLTIREMRHALDDARDDTQIGVIILAGEGEKAFCSGGDVKSMFLSTKISPLSYFPFLLASVNLSPLLYCLFPSINFSPLSYLPFPSPNSFQDLCLTKPITEITTTCNRPKLRIFSVP